MSAQKRWFIPALLSLLGVALWMGPIVLAQPNSTLFLVDAEGETIEGELSMGQAFSIVVFDEDQNLDDFIQEEVMVNVQIQSSAAPAVSITLVETFTNSGRFESDLLNSSMIGDLVVFPGQGLLFVYQDPDAPDDLVFLLTGLIEDNQALEPGVHREMIVIKFHEGTGIRLREGQFISLDGFDTFLLNNVLERNSPLQIERLFEETEEELERQRVELQFELGPPLADFNLYYLIETTFTPGAENLLNELRALNLVEDARFYQHPLVFAGGSDDEERMLASSSRPHPSASSSSTQTPDLSSSQGYLDPAPMGVDAHFAHTLPGGRGEGIRVIDMEQGWNLDHEDIDCCFTQKGSIPRTGDAVNHGTAVLGVIAGKDDNIGILGIAPAAQLGVVSWSDGVVAPRMKLAADQLRKGDVLLLEGQIAHPAHPDACSNFDQEGCLPLEVDPANFQAINYAVKRGIVVVQAAGNSGLDLDDPETYGGQLDSKLSRNAFAFLDSGALLVGAGNPPNQRDDARARDEISNFGSRLDVQGWGRLVATSGGPRFLAPWYSNLFDGGLNRQYTKSFAGTSSASALVAGVVAAVQGIKKAQGKSLLTSREMRELLVNTGTPQVMPSQHIGPLPNLRAVVEKLLGTSGSPTPPSPPPSVTSPVQLVDQDNDGFINDEEVQLALQWWITGTPILNTDVVLSDEDIKAIVQAWVANSPVPSVGAAAASLAAPLRVNSVSLAVHGHSFTLRAKGVGIQRLQLEVFDLAGKRVLSQSGSDSTLHFAPLDSSGHRWANGVYLYVVTAYGIDDEVKRLELRKLALLN